MLTILTMLTMFEEEIIIETFSVKKNCERNVVNVDDIDDVGYF